MRRVGDWPRRVAWAVVVDDGGKHLDATHVPQRPARRPLAHASAVSSSTVAGDHRSVLFCALP